MRLIWKISLVVMLVCLSCAHAANPLPPDQAFHVSAEVRGDHQIVTQWEAAPDYFLYADKIKFTITPDAPFDAVMPPPLKKQDAARGEVQVYSGKFTIPLQLHNNAGVVMLVVHYQGCSSQGFCYPPEKKSFELHFNASASNVIVTHQGISTLLTDQYGVQTLLASEQRGLLLLIFLGIGILLAFTPCVLPMLPILTAIIAGQKGKVSTRKAFLLSSCYVLGMAVMYALAGMLAAYAGSSLQVLLQTPSVIIISSLIFVLLAFSLFEFYELPISRRWQNSVTRWSGRHQGGTFAGVFFMGILSTLVVSPCITAPLVGVLLYIGRTGDMALGGSALFAMGIGMGIPLILLGMSAGHWLPKSGQWMHAVTKLFGVVMLGMALWLLGRIIQEGVMVVLWGLYLIGIALFFSLYLTRIIGRRKINHSIGVIAGFAGVFMIASTLGTPALLNRWLGETVPVTAPYSDFSVVHSESELMSRLAAAKSAGQPALVDFYADWCTSCVVMDKNVFAQKKIQSAIHPFALIRVDLSQNTEEDQQIMQKYDVVAPPTVLFFSVTGEEVNSRRIVGEMSANTFLKRIDHFKASGCDIKAQC